MLYYQTETTYRWLIARNSSSPTCNSGALCNYEQHFYYMSYKNIYYYVDLIVYPCLSEEIGYKMSKCVP